MKMLSEPFLQALGEALKTYPTPFYAYDWTQIRARVERLKEAFPQARLFYALKANPRLGLLRRLRALGLGAEAVSLGEVLRAYRAGFSPEEVLWNGPVKTEEALWALRERPPWVVLDSEGDLRRVSRLLPGARVLLRVNPDLPRGTHPHLATGRGESQFGVLPEEAPGLVSLARELGLKVLGLHLHLGSKLEALEDFLAGYRVLEGLFPKVGPVRVLDLGGGFGLGLRLEALREPLEAWRGFTGRRCSWSRPLPGGRGRGAGGPGGGPEAHPAELPPPGGGDDQPPPPRPLRGGPPRLAPLRGWGRGGLRPGGPRL